MSLKALAEQQIVKHTMVDYDVLLSRGWVSFSLPFCSDEDAREQLLLLANPLGKATPTRTGANVFDTLRPTEAETARPRSLSKIHAGGEFPLHVDTAHRLKPCRFIILACVSRGSFDRPTFLMDTRSLPLTESQLSLLHSTPLRVRNGRNSFFSTILSKTRPFVRYDPGCMTPITPVGAKTLAILARQHWPDHVRAVQWEAGKVLIIDNWRMLHGRGNADGVDFDRQLLRVSIQ
jgi:alpha-ketoglutarate-dependent taurine dioxygenase